MSNFKTALDIANKGGIPDPDLQEMYESTIVDDFFLDKLAEYIDEYIDTVSYTHLTLPTKRIV